MSARIPFPLPFPVVLGPDRAQPLAACPRPARPTPVADLGRYEDPSQPIGELIAVWNGSVLHGEHFNQKRGERSFRLGENPACDLWMPLEQLAGRDDVRLVRSEHGRLVVTVLPGAVALLRRPDGTTADVAELARQGRTSPSSGIADGQEVALEPGERLEQDFGEFTFLANMVPRPKLTLAAQRDWKSSWFLAASLALHVAFLGIAWRVQSEPEGIAIDSAGADNPYLQMMTLAPPQAVVAEEITIEQERETDKLKQVEEERPADDPDDVDDPLDNGGGAKAAGDSGQAGRRDADVTTNKLGVQGPRDNDNPHMAKTRLMEQVDQLGALSALQALQSNAPTSMFSPYSTALGNDPVDARGALMGSDYGDNYGLGGLGPFGTGVGGGGSNITGFGLNDTGLMGHWYGSRDDVGLGRPIGDLDRDRANRPDPTLRDHTGQGPEIRFSGEVQTFGGLSKEAIRRVIGLNRNRIRHCYEIGLRSTTDLAGRVTVGFVVAPQGNVQSAEIKANTTGDDQVAQCIASVIRHLNFPQADGITGATYPFLLQTADSE